MKRSKRVPEGLVFELGKNDKVLFAVHNGRRIACRVRGEKKWRQLDPAFIVTDGESGIEVEMVSPVEEVRNDQARSR